MPNRKKHFDKTAYCSICKEIKDKQHFHKDKSRTGGVSSRCKQCNVDYMKKYRKRQKKL